MAKLTLKIATPIILVGIFSLVVFVAAGYNQLNSAFYIIILVLVIFVFFFGLANGQNLTSPVRKLLGGATQLSEGNLSSRVYLETKDELSQLAKVFNKIAEELERTREQELNIEKSVGIKVKAKTKDLEETISALEQKIKNRTLELEKLIGESGRLQEDVKKKKEETVQLRKELDDFRQKINRYNKSKQDNVANNI
jgi:methyl-accepting chemotaxis protein